MNQPEQQAETQIAPPPLQSQPKRRRGYINAETVRAISFGVITLCIIISVIACIMAIWEFAQSDVLWRTVATCIVISGGMMAFAVINGLYGPKEP